MRATRCSRTSGSSLDKVKAVAEKRRKLPPGGELKEDYVFQWAAAAKNYLNK